MALCLLTPWIAQGQLAITEVMASSALNSENMQGSDFWELTNFGTNAIDLSGCQFSDARDSWTSLPGGIVIESGESIVFFQTNREEIMTVGQFTNWWGLAPAHRAFILPDMPGLSRFGDGARLRDANGNVVASVTFGESQTGVSLTYDCVLGVFGIDSILGIGGAFQAPEAPDIGSPCTNCGPVPIRIVTRPGNQFVPAGCDAEFSAVAYGMPPPRFQWTFNGMELDGATTSVLRLYNVQPANAGNYCVIISNGLEASPPLCATLTVTTNWSAPTISSPPRNCTVVVGWPAQFSANFCGYPQPALQWFSNNMPMPYETSRTLFIPECTFEMSAQYCLTISNELGTASACATLTVITNGTLQITEAMARSSSNSTPRKDWIEITNFGTNTLDLTGFRYVSSRGLGLDGASIIPEGVFIRPRESVVCVEGCTRDQFFAWWGWTNLPQDLQVIPWRGWGISSKGGEAITFWDPSTEDQFQVIAQVFPDVFVEGVSKYFGDECPLGCDSVPTNGGTFFAAQGGELGSPGFCLAPNLNIIMDGESVVLIGRSWAGTNYSLQFKNDLREGWNTLSSQIASRNAVIFRDPVHGEKRFYRIEELR
jgi:hypothetical protein